MSQEHSAHLKEQKRVDEHYICPRLHLSVFTHSQSEIHSLHFIIAQNDGLPECIMYILFLN